MAVHEPRRGSVARRFPPQPVPPPRLILCNCVNRRFWLVKCWLKTTKTATARIAVAAAKNKGGNRRISPKETRRQTGRQGGQTRYSMICSQSGRPEIRSRQVGHKRSFRAVHSREHHAVKCKQNNIKQQRITKRKTKRHNRKQPKSENKNLLPANLVRNNSKRHR